MTKISRFRTLLGTAPLLVIAAGLSACGSRDAQIAEQVMEAKQAAQRAEAARKAAEAAAARVNGSGPAVISAVEEVSETTVRDDEPEVDVNPDPPQSEAGSAG